MFGLQLFQARQFGCDDFVRDRRSSANLQRDMEVGDIPLTALGKLVVTAVNRRGRCENGFEQFNNLRGLQDFGFQNLNFLLKACFFI